MGLIEMYFEYKSYLLSQRSFIWSTLRETHQLIFRCVETEAEILGQGLLSSDLQTIHSSALMLTQCLVVFGAPVEIITK